MNERDGSAAAPGADAADEGLYDLSDEGRARQRAALRADRERVDRRAQRLVVVNTGPGKGKTTAALGLLLRAWGQGMRVQMFQFLKARTGSWGEIKAARRLGIAIEPLGDGFTWDSKDIAQDRALAQDGWRRCQAALSDETIDVVVLDELTYCLRFGWIDLDDLIATLERRPERQHVVITGRDAPPELVEYADLVTEMTVVKHPYGAGVKAQRGIEF